MTYNVGQQFKDHLGYVYTIVDMYTTTNLAGETVKVEYLCVHTLLGQEIRSRECAVTIARGIARMQGQIA